MGGVRRGGSCYRMRQLSGKVASGPLGQGASAVGMILKTLPETERAAKVAEGQNNFAVFEVGSNAKTWSLTWLYRSNLSD